MIIKGKLIDDGGWVDHPQTTCFNQYRPPTSMQLENITEADVEPWLRHIKAVYPTDFSHIISWFAQRVQHPEIKINHALMLGGNQGIGKDSILEPVKRAVGHWNFQEVSPAQIMGRFNAYLKSVVLRASEACDLGDAPGVNRFQMYERMKALTV